jgi:TPR repeat protein
LLKILKRLLNKWIRKSVEQGFAEAQCTLGDMYCQGQGVAQDFNEAVKWFRKAAKQGNAQAQEALRQLEH